MKKAKFETTCWIWPYASNGDGYGNANGKDAHRYIYELLVGPVPYKSELDHLCKTRLCVNPSHLEPVSHAVNCRRGRNSKLTGDDIMEIRRLAATMSHAEIAKAFTVSRQSISSIMKGERWANEGQPAPRWSAI